MTKLTVISNNTREPYDAGAALAAHRRVLENTVERLEAEQERLVLACRREGYSWAEIAEILDVTRQVVQKRYGGRDAEPLHEKPRHRRPLPWLRRARPAPRQEGRHKSSPGAGRELPDEGLRVRVESERSR